MLSLSHIIFWSWRCILIWRIVFACAPPKYADKFRFALSSGYALGAAAAIGTGTLEVLERALRSPLKQCPALSASLLLRTADGH